MLCEVITAICRNRLELVVGEARTELVSRSPAGAEELIVWVVHLIHLKCSLEVAFIERRVMGHQWKPLYLGSNLCPYFRKHPGIHGVFHGQSMHLRVPVGVILRLRLDEGVVAIHYLAIPYDYDTHGALLRSLLAVSKSIAAKSFMLSKFLVLWWNPNQFIDNSCKVTRNLRQIVSYIEDISPMSSSFAVI